MYTNQNYHLVEFYGSNMATRAVTGIDVKTHESVTHVFETDESFINFMKMEPRQNDIIWINPKHEVPLHIVSKAAEGSEFYALPASKRLIDNLVRIDFVINKQFNAIDNKLSEELVHEKLTNLVNEAVPIDSESLQSSRYLVIDIKDDIGRRKLRATDDPRFVGDGHISISRASKYITERVQEGATVELTKLNRIFTKPDLAIGSRHEPLFFAGLRIDRINNVMSCDNLTRLITSDELHGLKMFNDDSTFPVFSTIDDNLNLPSRNPKTNKSNDSSYPLRFENVHNTDGSIIGVLIAATNNNINDFSDRIELSISALNKKPFRLGDKYRFIGTEIGLLGAYLSDLTGIPPLYVEYNGQFVELKGRVDDPNFQVLIDKLIKDVHPVFDGTLIFKQEDAYRVTSQLGLEEVLPANTSYQEQLEKRVQQNNEVISSSIKPRHTDIAKAARALIQNPSAEFESSRTKQTSTAKPSKYNSKTRATTSGHRPFFPSYYKWQQARFNQDPNLIMSHLVSSISEQAAVARIDFTDDTLSRISLSVHDDVQLKQTELTPISGAGKANTIMLKASSKLSGKPGKEYCVVHFSFFNPSVSHEVGKAASTWNSSNYLYNEWKNEKEYYESNPKAVLALDLVDPNKEITPEEINRRNKLKQEQIERRAAEIEEKEQSRANLRIKWNNYMSRAESCESDNSSLALKGIGAIADIVKLKQGVSNTDNGANPWFAWELKTLDGKHGGWQRVYLNKWASPLDGSQSNKAFTKGTIRSPEQGSHAVVGEINELTKSLYYTEGFADGASAHLAVGEPVVVAGDLATVNVVIQHYQKLFPHLNHVNIADNDCHQLLKGENNSGALKAIQIAFKHKVSFVLPFLGASGAEGKKCDINDVHLERGLDEVKRQLDSPASIEYEGDYLNELIKHTGAKKLPTVFERLWDYQKSLDIQIGDDVIIEHIITTASLSHNKEVLYSALVELGLNRPEAQIAIDNVANREIDEPLLDEAIKPVAQITSCVHNGEERCLIKASASEFVVVGLTREFCRDSRFSNSSVSLSNTDINYSEDLNGWVGPHIKFRAALDAHLAAYTSAPDLVVEEGLLKGDFRDRGLVEQVKKIYEDTGIYFDEKRYGFVLQLDLSADEIKTRAPDYFKLRHASIDYPQASQDDVANYEASGYLGLDLPIIVSARNALRAHTNNSGFELNALTAGLIFQNDGIGNDSALLNAIKEIKLDGINHATLEHSKINIDWLDTVEKTIESSLDLTTSSIVDGLLATLDDLILENRLHSESLAVQIEDEVLKFNLPGSVYDNAGHLAELAKAYTKSKVAIKEFDKLVRLKGEVVNHPIFQGITNVKEPYDSELYKKLDGFVGEQLETFSNKLSEEDISSRQHPLANEDETGSIKPSDRLITNWVFEEIGIKWSPPDALKVKYTEKVAEANAGLDEALLLETLERLHAHIDSINVSKSNGFNYVEHTKLIGTSKSEPYGDGDRFNGKQLSADLSFINKYSVAELPVAIGVTNGFELFDVINSEVSEPEELDLEDVRSRVHEFAESAQVARNNEFEYLEFVELIAVQNYSVYGDGATFVESQLVRDLKDGGWYEFANAEEAFNNADVIIHSFAKEKQLTEERLEGFIEQIIDARDGGFNYAAFLANCESVYTDGTALDAELLSADIEVSSKYSGLLVYTYNDTVAPIDLESIYYTAPLESPADIRIQSQLMPEFTRVTELLRSIHNSIDLGLGIDSYFTSAHEADKPYGNGSNIDSPLYKKDIKWLASALPEHPLFEHPHSTILDLYTSVDRESAALRVGWVDEHMEKFINERPGVTYKTYSLSLKDIRCPYYNAQTNEFNNAMYERDFAIFEDKAVSARSRYVSFGGKDDSISTRDDMASKIYTGITKREGYEFERSSIEDGYAIDVYRHTESSTLRALMINDAVIGYLDNASFLSGVLSDLASGFSELKEEGVSLDDAFRDGEVQFLIDSVKYLKSSPPSDSFEISAPNIISKALTIEVQATANTVLLKENIDRITFSDISEDKKRASLNNLFEKRGIAFPDEVIEQLLVKGDIYQTKEAPKRLNGLLDSISTLKDVSSKEDIHKALYNAAFMTKSPYFNKASNKTNVDLIIQDINATNIDSAIDRIYAKLAFRKSEPLEPNIYYIDELMATIDKSRLPKLSNNSILPLELFVQTEEAGYGLLPIMANNLETSSATDLMKYPDYEISLLAELHGLRFDDTLSKIDRCNELLNYIHLINNKEERDKLKVAKVSIEELVQGSLLFKSIDADAFIQNQRAHFINTLAGFNYIRTTITLDAAGIELPHYATTAAEGIINGKKLNLVNDKNIQKTLKERERNAFKDSLSLAHTVRTSNSISESIIYASEMNSIEALEFNRVNDLYFYGVPKLTDELLKEVGITFELVTHSKHILSSTGPIDVPTLNRFGMTPVNINAKVAASLNALKGYISSGSTSYFKEAGTRQIIKVAKAKKAKSYLITRYTENGVELDSIIRGEKDLDTLALHGVSPLDEEHILSLVMEHKDQTLSHALRLCAGISENLLDDEVLLESDKTQEVLNTISEALGLEIPSADQDYTPRRAFTTLLDVMEWLKGKAEMAGQVKSKSTRELDDKLINNLCNSLTELAFELSIHSLKHKPEAIEMPYMNQEAESINVFVSKSELGFMTCEASAPGAKQVERRDLMVAGLSRYTVRGLLSDLGSKEELLAYRASLFCIANSIDTNKLSAIRESLLSDQSIERTELKGSLGYIAISNANETSDAFIQMCNALKAFKIEGHLNDAIDSEKRRGIFLNQLSGEYEGFVEVSEEASNVVILPETATSLSESVIIPKSKVIYGDHATINNTLINALKETSGRLDDIVERLEKQATVDNIYLISALNKFADISSDISIDNGRLIHQNTQKTLDLYSIFNEFEVDNYYDNVKRLDRLLKSDININLHQLPREYHADTVDNYLRIHSPSNKKRQSSKDVTDQNILACEAIRKLKSGDSSPELIQEALQYTGWSGISAAAKERAKIGMSLHLQDTSLKAEHSIPLTRSMSEAAWSALRKAGFKGGRLLIPNAAQAQAIVFAPSSIANISHFVAIESDPFSHEIIGLQKNTTSINDSLVNAHLPDAYFDAAIGVFSGQQIKGFEKAVDSIKPGGLGCFIVDSSFLDSTELSVKRAALAEKMDIVSTERLKNVAFTRPPIVANIKGNSSNSGDIQNDGSNELNEMFDIILVHKAPALSPAWALHKSGVSPLVNANLHKPFVTIANSTISRSASLHDIEQAKLLAFQHHTPNKELLNQAVQTDLKEGPFSTEKLPDAFVMTDEGPKISWRINIDGEWADTLVGFDNLNRNSELIADYIILRDAFQEFTKASLEQLTESESLRLNCLQCYSSFEFKHGSLQMPKVRAVLKEDSLYKNTCLAETFDENTMSSKPSKLLSTTNIYTSPGLVFDGPVDSESCVRYLSELSILDKGLIDHNKAEMDLGIPWHEIESLAGEYILKSQMPGYALFKAHTLTGNISKQISSTEILTSLDPIFNENLKSIKSAAQTDFTIHDISLVLGQNWLPSNIVRDFIVDYVSTSANIEEKQADWVEVANINDTWVIKTSENAPGSFTSEIKGKLSHQGEDFINVVQRLSNLIYTGTIIKDKVALFDFRDHLNHALDRFVNNDENIQKQIVEAFNQRFNVFSKPDYTITAPVRGHLNELNDKPLELYGSQTRSVNRYLNEGNVFSAHACGKGKTFEYITTAMQGKSLGVHNKPALIVPLSVINDVEKAALTLYPHAKIFKIDSNSISNDHKIEKVTGTISSAPWDLIIIPHNLVKRLKVPASFVETLANDEVEHLYHETFTAKATSNTEITAIKAAHKDIETMKAAISNMYTKTSFANKLTIEFDKTGIDCLLIDESDNFLNLQTQCKIQAIKGETDGKSKLANSLYFLARYVQLNNNGKGVGMFTGTDFRNSIKDFYTNLRYVAPRALKDAGVYSFDSFIGNFGDITYDVELTPGGESYEANVRLSGLRNVAALKRMYNCFVDQMSPEEIKLYGNEPADNRVTINSVPGELYDLYSDVLAERAITLSLDAPLIENDTVMSIRNDGFKAAIDMRLIDSNLPEDPNSKTSLLIKQILNKYDSLQCKEQLQIVFSDLGVNEINGFHLFGEIRDKLLASGVFKPEEVVLANQFTEEKDKAALDIKLNNGEIKVCLASTEMLGVGRNVQQRVAAIYHLDVPWRNRDLEQRNKRGIREGNTNDSVDIVTMITPNSLEVIKLSAQNRKSNLESAMKSKDNNIMISESKETTLTDVINCLADKDLMIKRMQYSGQLNSLRTQKTDFERHQTVLNNQVNTLKEDIALKLQHENTHKALLDHIDNHTLSVGYKGDEPKPVEQWMEVVKADVSPLLDSSESVKGLCLGDINGHIITLSQDEPLSINLPSIGLSFEINELNDLTQLESLITSELKRSLSKPLDAEYQSVSNQIEMIKLELAKEFPHDDKINSLVKSIEELDTSLVEESKELAVTHSLDRYLQQSESVKKAELQVSSQAKPALCM